MALETVSFLIYKIIALGSSKEMTPCVSIVITVRSVEKYIASCIMSILDQTFNNFEIVIVDDMSNDNTKNIIEEFDDKRIKYFKNIKWLGIPRSRNRGLSYATGEYIFFTDGDCTVSKNWIEEGLEYLRDPNCVGVEGRIYYVSDDYEPSFSDHVTENRYGGHFMTGNVAYKKSVIERVGGFDERYTYLEDRDLALRAMKFGRLDFNPEMIVYHPKNTLKPRQFVQVGKRIRNWALLYKKFGEESARAQTSFLWRIVHPLNLMAMIFPPLIFVSFFRNRYKSKEDFVLFPFIYPKLIYERLNLWDMCIKERVFLI
jgi:glycosyltransferase involved in cell wall biosynthesis